MLQRNTLSPFLSALYLSSSRTMGEQVEPPENAHLPLT
jgi:hypothetical protein